MISTSSTLGKSLNQYLIFFCYSTSLVSGSPGCRSWGWVSLSSIYNVYQSIFHLPICLSLCSSIYNLSIHLFIWFLISCWFWFSGTLKTDTFANDFILLNVSNTSSIWLAQGIRHCWPVIFSLSCQHNCNWDQLKGKNLGTPMGDFFWIRFEVRRTYPKSWCHFLVVA